MRISLVIPTRERAELLASCIDAALAVRDRDFEIVVSDNASTDATADVIAARRDPRLHCTATTGRVSMRQNFETALGACTGDYVIFIGDDDGVLPSGIAMLRRFLEAERPEAVIWPLLGYTWPSNRPGHDRGFVHIKRASLFGGVRRQPARDVLADVLSARIRNYREAANIYHGCIAREVIERVRERCDGTYFAGAIPDVFVSIANLIAIGGDLARLGHPVTFGGASDRSQGAAQTGAAKAPPAGQAETRAFVRESADDAGAAGIDLAMPSIDALTLDMAEIATRGTPHADRIDWDAWLNRIARRLARLPRPKHEAGAAILRAYCAERGRTGPLERALARHPFHGTEQAQDGSRPQTSRLRPARITLAHPEALATVADGARVLDRVIGPHDPARPGGILRWAGALARARREIRGWR